MNKVLILFSFIDALFIFSNLCYKYNIIHKVGEKYVQGFNFKKPKLPQILRRRKNFVRNVKGTRGLGAAVAKRREPTGIEVLFVGR